MDATTQECGEVSKVTSFETIIDAYERDFHCLATQQLFFPDKNTVIELVRGFQLNKLKIK